MAEGDDDNAPKSAKAFLPKTPTLTSLRKAAQGCRGCALYKNATQTVFGEGDTGARILLVGEQPGNDEDLEGRPFVGPPDACSTKAWPPPGSTATRPTSPT